MGILYNGIAGGFTGKVGGLVGYRLKGKYVVRVARTITKPPTVPQLSVRQKMNVVGKFFNPLKEFINVGFKVKAAKAMKLPHNMAASYHIKNALKGEYPNIEMDYTKVLVAQGNLEMAEGPSVELVAEGLKFTWLCGLDMPWPKNKDRVMLVAYFPELQKAVYLLCGAQRIEGTQVLRLNSSMLGAYMETYISFIAEDRHDVSNSTYIGNFNVM